MRNFKKEVRFLPRFHKAFNFLDDAMREASRIRGFVKKRHKFYIVTIFKGYYKGKRFKK